MIFLLYKLWNNAPLMLWCPGSTTYILLATWREGACVCSSLLLATLLWTQLCNLQIKPPSFQSLFPWMITMAIKSTKGPHSSQWDVLGKLSLIQIFWERQSNLIVWTTLRWIFHSREEFFSKERTAVFLRPLPPWRESRCLSAVMGQ